METIYTPDDILSMKLPTDKFLVELKDNIFGIRFKGFKLRDCDSGEIFHNLETQNVYELDHFASNILKYKFPLKILETKTLGSNLILVVGDQLVKNLDLIERHYIDDELVANYKFNFPLFMPGTENSIEFIYKVPVLNEETIKQKSKKEINAKSDTFIFVDNKLIIHRRAEYVYQ